MNAYRMALLRIVFLAVAVVAGTQASQAQANAPHTPIVTSGTGWMLQLPAGPVMPAVVITGFGSSWSFPLGQSKWIGPNEHAGLYPTPPGSYTYTYRFCYFMARNGLQPAVPTLHLDVLADDGFDAYLNGAASPFLSRATGFAFNHVTSGSVPLGTSGYGTLKIVVHNANSTPTGLDVNGWITAYLNPCHVLSRKHKETVTAPPPKRL